jgi:hypothetical protein
MATARACGSCRLCCKLMAVEEIDKKRDVWCRHACEKGCAIYKERPGACRDFICRWLADDNFPDYWFPARSKIVIDAQIDVWGRMVVSFNVDPAYPARWREAPYFEDIKKLARAGLTGVDGHRFLTVVIVGHEIIPLL